MSTLQVQIMLIALVVSVASALPGVFLVLRGVALMSDAISHAVLLGIALMFLVTYNLDSPLLLVGAALAGVATVFLTESVIQTRRLKKDAAIGIVFPLFFSIGVLLISVFARDVHLDIDMVILGEIAFAPFNRLILAGFDVGPLGLWSMGVILLINVLFIFLFYKELKAATFDSDFAFVAGLSPTFLYYALMMITSITAVGAFDVVGSIVVVALMITPPATAYLLTKKLDLMIWLSVFLSCISSLLGYAGAAYYDVSIAGAIATVTGLIFVFVLFFSPETGLIASFLTAQRRKRTMAHDLLCSHLKKLARPCSLDELSSDFGWNKAFIVSLATESTLIYFDKNILTLA